MFIVVDMEAGGKILWQDTRVCTSKGMAMSRLEFFKKKCPNKNYRIIRFTNYKIAA